MTTASLVCSRSSSDWRTMVRMARNVAVMAMPISNGMSQFEVCRIRISSTKILENPATTMLGTTSARLTTTSSPTAVFEPRNSRSNNRNPLGSLPVFTNASVRPLHGQHDAGEREIEFRHVDPSPPDRGIVDIDAVAVDAFQHHEMVEVPVNDAGHLAFSCRRAWLLAKTLADRPKPRRLDDVAGLAADPGAATASPV